MSEADSTSRSDEHRRSRQERVRADEALHASEARLAAGAELAGLAFSELDWLTGVMVYADERLRDLLGFPTEGELGVDASAVWSGRLHPEDRAGVMEMRRRLLEGEVDRASAEYRYTHPERGETWIQHLAGVAARGADGRTSRTYGVLRDITARKRVEEELRDLSRRLIGAHEEERALLARELHDDVSQRLAVLAIEAGRAELGLPDGPQLEALRTIREGIVRVSEDIHSLAYQLHPSLLEELGLAEALRAECEHRSRQHEFEVTADVDPVPPAVDKDVALCLFRVAQEAVGNAARHARASSVSVTLRQVDGGLLLAVADDGAGFDPKTPGAGCHLGLASMRERTRLVNGTLDVDSVPGRGTTVLAWAPMTESPE
jgi:PAS domain S-box-containing protein